MTSATDLFRGCSPSCSLSGGGAPARFSSELGHSARSHQPLSFASSWVQGFVHAVPALGGGPVYGELLGPLSDALLHPQSSQPARSRLQRSPARAAPALSRSQASAGSRSRESGRHSSTAESTASASNRAASKQATAAGGSSARVANLDGSANGGRPQPARISAGNAGSPGVSTSTAVAMTYRQSGSTGLAPISRAMPLAVSPPRADGPGRAASVSLSPRAIRGWRERLAERVAARLILCGMGENNEPNVVALPELWSQLVDGPTASLELLMQAATADVFSATSDVCSASSAGCPSAPTVLMPPRAPAETITAPAGTGLNTVADTPALFPIPIAAVEQSTVATMREVGEELLSNVPGQACMPLLLPSAHAATQAPCGPPPASLTRTAMAPMYQQDFDSGDELAWLSLKMKRVLDEEARRHGIKV